MDWVELFLGKNDFLNQTFFGHISLFRVAGILEIWHDLARSQRDELPKTSFM
jgi:hypothetical protein